MSTQCQPDARSIAYAIASRAGTDHRPILKWLKGEASLPRGSAGERIALIAEEIGVAPSGAGPSAKDSPFTTKKPASSEVSR